MYRWTMSIGKKPGRVNAEHEHFSRTDVQRGSTMKMHNSIG